MKKKTNCNVLKLKHYFFFFFEIFLLKFLTDFIQMVVLSSLFIERRRIVLPVYACSYNKNNPSIIVVLLSIVCFNAKTCINNSIFGLFV